MRKFVAILLSVAFLALGTGALEFLHNLDHKAEDARLAADAAAAAAGCESGTQSGHRHSHPAPLHDNTNCETHALLHMPTVAAGATPLLVLLGLFVAFLTLLAATPVSHRPMLCLDCRGPPAC